MPTTADTGAGQSPTAPSIEQQIAAAEAQLAKQQDSPTPAKQQPATNSISAADQIAQAEAQLAKQQQPAATPQTSSQPLTQSTADQIAQAEAQIAKQQEQGQSDLHHEIGAVQSEIGVSNRADQRGGWISQAADRVAQWFKQQTQGASLGEAVNAIASVPGKLIGDVGNALSKMQAPDLVTQEAQRMGLPAMADPNNAGKIQAIAGTAKAAADAGLGAHDPQTQFGKNVAGLGEFAAVFPFTKGATLADAAAAEGVAIPAAARFVARSAVTAARSGEAQGVISGDPSEVQTATIAGGALQVAGEAGGVAVRRVYQWLKGAGVKPEPVTAPQGVKPGEAGSDQVSLKEAADAEAMTPGEPAAQKVAAAKRGGEQVKVDSADTAPGEPAAKTTETPAATPAEPAPALLLDRTDGPAFFAAMRNGELSKAVSLLKVNGDYLGVDFTDQTAADLLDMARHEVTYAGQRIGVNRLVPDAEVAKLAAARNVTPETLLALHSDTLNAGQLSSELVAHAAVPLAARQIALDTVKAAIKGGEGAPSIADAEAALVRYYGQNATANAAKSEIGRALHAAKTVKERDLADLNAQTNPAELQEALGQIKSPEAQAVLRAMQDQIEQGNAAEAGKALANASFATRLQRFLVANFISSVISGVGSVKHVFLTFPVTQSVDAMTRLTAAAIGGTRRLFGARDTYSFEIARAAQFAGTAQGAKVAFALDAKALRNAADSIASGQFREAIQNLASEKHGTVWRSYASGELKQGFATEDVGAQMGSHMDDFENIAKGDGARAFWRIYGRVASVMSRTHLAIDTMGRSVTAYQNIVELANAKAMQEAAEAGLKGDGFTAYVKERAARLQQAPTADMMEQANTRGAENSLTSKAGPIAHWMNQLPEAFHMPILRIISPFNRLAGNMVSYAGRHLTPLGILYPSVMKRLAAGGMTRDLAAAQIAVGSMVSGVIGSLVYGGYITGRGSPQSLAANIPQNSIKLGKTWVETKSLGPAGELMRTFADAYEIMNDGLDPTADKDTTEKVAGAVMALVLGGAKGLLDSSVMAGVKNIVDAIDDKSGKRASRLLTTMAIGEMPQSALLRSIRQDHDNFMRGADTFLEQLRNTIPGLSNSLAVRRDVLGRPLTYQHGQTGLQWLSPLGLSPVSTDPVDKAISEMKSLSATPTTISPGLNAPAVKLTAEQQSEFARLTGEYVMPQLRALVTGGNWDDLSKATGPYRGMRDQIILRLFAAGRYVARYQLEREYPDLAKKLNDARTKAMQARVGQIATQQ